MKDLDSNAKMDVVINNVRTSEQSIEKIIEIISDKLGGLANNYVSRIIDSGSDPLVYEVRFKLLDPKKIKPETIANMLADYRIDFSDINGTFVE